MTVHILNLKLQPRVVNSWKLVVWWE